MYFALWYFRQIHVLEMRPKHIFGSCLGLTRVVLCIRDQRKGLTRWPERHGGPWGSSFVWKKHKPLRNSIKCKLPSSMTFSRALLLKDDLFNHICVPRCRVQLNRLSICLLSHVLYFTIIPRSGGE